MPKQGLSLIAWVLDQSGSMNSIHEPTVAAFNRTLEEQKQVPGAALFSLTLFNTDFLGIPKIEQRHTATPLAQVPPMRHSDFIPAGWTPLYDAVCQTIDQTGAYLAGLPERERPERVLFVVQTDGMENKSTEFSAADVKTRIEHQREKYGWQFLFLGAELDKDSTVVREQSLAMGFMASAGYLPDATHTPLAAAYASNVLREARVGTKTLDTSGDEDFGTKSLKERLREKHRPTK